MTVDSSTALTLGMYVCIHTGSIAICCNRVLHSKAIDVPWTRCRMEEYLSSKSNPLPLPCLHQPARHYPVALFTYQPTRSHLSDDIILATSNRKLAASLKWLKETQLESRPPHAHHWSLQKGWELRFLFMSL
jgi:hypothetical protein